MNKLLSIVIPTYNMEKYLDRCLSSLIISDDEIMDRLEVLVVIDGSTDHSSEIAYNYHIKFPSVFRVIEKENGNYGSCVNRGIDEANGKYFRILDADDYFNNESLVKFMKIISDFCEEPDLIISNYQEDHASGFTKFFINDVYEYGKIYDSKDVVLCRYKSGYLAAMHRMTYKLDVVKKAGLRHLEGISYTDSEYCFYPLREVKTILFVNILLYCYQIGREGQTVSVLSYQKNIHNIYRIIDRMLNSLNDEDKKASYYRNQTIVLKECLSVYYYILLTGQFEHNEDLRAMDQRILSFDPDIYNSLLTIRKSGFLPIVKFWRNGWMTNSKFFMLLYHFMDFFVAMYRKLQR